MAPTTWVLDNETSKELKMGFQEAEVTFQLVTPYKHRNNQAERAIQTFKHHFKAGLASVDPNFPLAEWHRLILQANITLNLLRNARVNPKLSAYAYIFGNYDFSATPMAPPGTKVIAHSSPDKRGSWELNGEVGWYVGPAMDHYRCVDIYFPTTRMTRACDTVDFFPHDDLFPEIKTKDFLHQAATDLIDILTKPPSTIVPTLEAGDPVQNALQKISEQLKAIKNIPADQATKKPDTSSPRVKEREKNQGNDAESPRV